MKKEVFKFLKEYNYNELAINRLLVSSFVLHQNIQNITNRSISNLLIQPDELEYGVLQQFLNLLLKTNKKFGFEELLELFELVISPSDKLINGAIYTPSKIRKYITQQAFHELNKTPFEKVKVADIACGCGGFLIDASVELRELTGKSFKAIYKENIFGVDIQSYSIERTKILLTLLALTHGEDENIFKFNLYTGDSLEFDWYQENNLVKQNKGFDIILGNPPYVCARNLDKKTKVLMSNWDVCKVGNPDLYIPFFQVGYELLKPNGVLGFITVNTFITSVNGRGTREYFQKKQVLLKIIDFRDQQIFKSRSTYTCLCLIEKKQSDHIFYANSQVTNLVNLNKISFNKTAYIDTDFKKGWNLKNRDFIKKIEAVGIPFGKKFETKSGIATLKNHVYMFTPLKESVRYFYMHDGTKIEKGICKDIVNTNLLNSHQNIDQIKEKIIFPYVHSENNLAVLIDEKKLSKKYPHAYKYLLSQKDLLSTRDKGNGSYPAWYAFGRTQSLDKRKNKLFFPHLIKKGFHSTFNNDELYFYNGMAAYAEDQLDLRVLEKLIASDLFWNYIENSCKPYTSGYYGLGKNYLKDFGIYDFSDSDKDLLLNIESKIELNSFLYKKYGCLTISKKLVS